MLALAASSTCSAKPGEAQSDLVTDEVTSLLQLHHVADSRHLAKDAVSNADFPTTLKKLLCNTPHPEDLDRPISEVRAEHPDADLFCYFAPHVPWFDPLAQTTGLYSYDASFDEVKAVFGPYLGHNAGPLVSFHFDGAPPSGLWSHVDADNYWYDDPYCYTLGFLKNQNVDGSLLHNYSAWKAIAKSECDKWQAEYNFAPEELTVGSHVAYNPTIMEESHCAGGGGPANCTKITAREYKLHAYAKCALGDEAPEMTYCYRRGCLLKNFEVNGTIYENYIGHGPEDCGTD